MNNGVECVQKLMSFCSSVRKKKTSTNTKEKECRKSACEIGRLSLILSVDKHEEYGLHEL